MTEPYLVEAENPIVRQAYEWAVADAGYDLAETPDDATIVSVGGDGSILYNVERYGDPTILPVRYGDSEGRRCTVEPEEFRDALHAVDDGRYDVHSHRKLAAYDETGEKLRDDFEALNEIGLHRQVTRDEPPRTVAFDLTLSNPEMGVERDIGPVQSDGLIVSTPFGSTAYFATVTAGTDMEGFDTGIGVALNNVDKPRDLRSGFVLDESATVSIEIRDKDHKAPAYLFPDIKDGYEPAVGEEITIRPMERTVDILDPET